LNIGAKLSIVVAMLEKVTKRRLDGVVPNRAAVHLRAFYRDAKRALPGKITGAILFGSRARGDARRDSDYDVAVLVQGLGDRRSVDHALADTAYPHILAGVHIRPVAVPADFLTVSPRSGFAMALLRDGVMVS
jgi:Polymerase beta, Nucleotidyltransferase